MRDLVRSISFSYIGYLLLLIGFTLLGLFVAALALGATAGAWGCGVGAAAAYALSVAAFRFQMRESAETTSNDALILHGDPLMPAVERDRIDRYEDSYRDVTLSDAA